MDALTIGIKKAGGLAAFASLLSALNEGGRVFTPQTVSQWRARGRVPVDAVWVVSKATSVPVWEIRPDVYDRPDVYLAKTACACQIEATRE